MQYPDTPSKYHYVHVHSVSGFFLWNYIFLSSVHQAYFGEVLFTKLEIPREAWWVRLLERN